MTGLVLADQIEVYSELEFEVRTVRRKIRTLVNQQLGRRNTPKVRALHDLDRVLSTLPRAYLRRAVTIP